MARAQELKERVDPSRVLPVRSRRLLPRTESPDDPPYITLQLAARLSWRQSPAQIVQIVLLRVDPGSGRRVARNLR